MNHKDYEPHFVNIDAEGDIDFQFEAMTVRQIVALFKQPEMVKSELQNILMGAGYPMQAAITGVDELFPQIRDGMRIQLQKTLDEASAVLPITKTTTLH